ncbi:DNA phosphorothioation-dependent restriction protein DptF [Pradoshia eiseniae]|uniref:DNA phosphorothioation-dependent restriction protein DptF n=1 Tax=Pradoshia eiseniae TaxID=2064768 RepID=A0A2S7N454_9BACI|nr:DNA phosphorothioation-dependent restriction protein DptF [Pradoshia eiseniae]
MSILLENRQVLDLQKYAFEFIEPYKSGWGILAEEFENTLFSDIDSSLIKARKLCELIVEDIFRKEKIEYSRFLKHVEALAALRNTEVLDETLFKSFDRIRRLGNTAAHEHGKIAIIDGLHAHRNLYEILKWYVEVYESYEAKIPEYQEAKPHNPQDLSEQVKQIISEMVPQYMGQFKEEKSEQLQTEVMINEMSTIQGSHLLYQLSKLRESSQDAVEGYKGLSEFKRYLHVKRPLEEILERHINEAVESSVSQIIFVCGSVGDGKSHLLSHLSSTIPEKLAQFEIHNDATESFDPKKNSLDTLAEVLKPFSDSRIEHSNEKLILAINLGVLNNFLESEYATNDFTRIRNYIVEANVFDSNSISVTKNHPHFRLVNFGDYNMYELTPNGPVSSYISDLFSRITNPVAQNPFYQAYKKDKQTNEINTLLVNYEMFSSKTVQEQIIKLIIKTIIKDKIILSSRILLNYIYDILVPITTEEMMTSDFLDMLPNLLPNLVFEGFDKSPFLKMMARQDPIHQRSIDVDRSLIDLHNNGSYYIAYRNVIHDSSAQEWISYLESIEDIAYLDKDTKRELSELFIRSCYLYESSLQDAFLDKVYMNYTKYLYAYNTGQKRMLQNLYFDIDKSIYLWKGAPKTNYLYIDEEGHQYRIAERLQLRNAPKALPTNNLEVVERFTSSLVLGFRCDPFEEIHEVEIDLSLYSLIVRVNNGYRLNKKDRDDSIKFIEFIENLLPFGRQMEEILITDTENGHAFLLEYDPDFETYSFRREN